MEHGHLLLGLGHQIGTQHKLTRSSLVLSLGEEPLLLHPVEEG